MTQSAEWQSLMTFGLGFLNRSPDEFWSMTLRELLAATGAAVSEGHGNVDRVWLDKAMQQHPDTSPEKEDR